MLLLALWIGFSLTAAMLARGWSGVCWVLPVAAAVALAGAAAPVLAAAAGCESSRPGDLNRLVWESLQLGQEHDDEEIAAAYRCLLNGQRARLGADAAAVALSGAKLDLTDEERPAPLWRIEATRGHQGSPRCEGEGVPA